MGKSWRRWRIASWIFFHWKILRIILSLYHFKLNFRSYDLFKHRKVFFWGSERRVLVSNRLPKTISLVQVLVSGQTSWAQVPVPGQALKTGHIGGSQERRGTDRSSPQRDFGGFLQCGLGKELVRALWEKSCTH